MRAWHQNQRIILNPAFSYHPLVMLGNGRGTARSSWRGALCFMPARKDNFMELVGIIIGAELAIIIYQLTKLKGHIAWIETHTERLKKAFIDGERY